MTGHRKVRLLLYDYVRGDLDAERVQSVEYHLAGCRDCSREAESHRELLRALPGPSRKPSDALPGSYWTGFVNEVMSGIDAPAPKRAWWVRWIPGGNDTALTGTGWGGRRIAAGLAVVATVVAVVWLASPRGGAPARDVDAVNQETVSEGPAATDFTGEGADQTDQFDRRLSDYFRKSKTLLVGVSNLAPAKGESVDLDAERRTSRTLLREARYLRSGPVDARSSRLIDDLDRILIGLANGEESASVPDVKMIRGGIESRNLLFKLRMQETRNQRVPVQQASYNR